MDFELSGPADQWRAKLQEFFAGEVLPCHRDWLARVASSPETPPFMAELRQKARAVHLRQIFRMEAMPSWSVANSPYLAAHPL